MWQIIVKEGKVLLQKIETGEQLAVQYLEKEARQAAAFFKTEFSSPTIEAQVTKYIADGEQALASLAQSGEEIVVKDAPEWVAGAETWLGNVVQAKIGGATGNLIVELGDEGLQLVESIGLNIFKAALAKVLAGLAPAAAAL